MSVSVIIRQHLSCYLCGASVGHVDSLRHAPHVRRLVRDDGSVEPLPTRGGLPRCCFCGGSLYLDDVEILKVWPRTAFGPEKPGRKPRAVREALQRQAAELRTAG